MSRWTWVAALPESVGHTTGTVCHWPSGHVAAWLSPLADSPAGRAAVVYRDHPLHLSIGLVPLAPGVSDADAHAILGAILDGWWNHYAADAALRSTP